MPFGFDINVNSALHVTAHTNRPLTINAVVVTYNPSIEAELLPLLDRLQDQVEHIFVVDNASTNAVQAAALASQYPHVTFVPAQSNFGVGAAQNIGIRHALQAGAQYVLLSDQDSMPATNMVDQLYTAAQALAGSGVRVASVGPCHTNTLQNNPTIHAASCDSPSKCIPVQHMIASGMLIPRDALETIGAMNESLFIDYVDTEWCLRAASRGYLCFTTAHAKMDHRIGTPPIVFMGKHYMTPPH